MSNIVGNLTLRTFQQNGRDFVGFGALSMLAHQFKFAVSEFVSNNPDAPCFTVHAKTPDERLVDIGKAWRKLIKQGEHEGKPFFSFTFDDPSLEKPINVSAFPTRETGVYEIVWQRPKRQAEALPQASRLDDEIPF